MKRKLTAISLLLVAISAPSFSEEADKPDFNGQPRRFEKIQDVTMIREGGPEAKRVKNQVWIGREKSKSLPFWVYVNGENLHLCSISGNAKREGRHHFVYREGDCSIDIRLSGRDLKLTDVGGSCAAQYCAPPAVFGVREFHETGK